MDEIVRQREVRAAIEAAAEEERQRLIEAEEKRKRMGAWVCGACGRSGCPVMPYWQSWSEGDSPPVPIIPYNGNNGPAVTGPPPSVV